MDSVKLARIRLGAYLGSDSLVLVNSGTSALEVALRALDLEEGRSVLVPSLGCDAIAMSVINCGLLPYFYEVGPKLQPIIEEAPSSAEAIIVVFHFGLVPPGLTPDGLSGFRARGWKVIADCAPALGSYYCGRHVGLSADIAIFSFADGKQVECGEGGAILAQNQALRQRANELANCGRVAGSYNRRLVGRNLTMAHAVVEELIRKLEQWPQQRRQRAERARVWNDTLSTTVVQLLQSVPNARTTPHWVVGRIDDVRRPLRAEIATWADASPTAGPWWPLVPIEKDYNRRYYRELASVVDWRRNGILLSVSPRISVSTIEGEAARLADLVGSRC